MRTVLSLLFILFLTLLPYEANSLHQQQYQQQAVRLTAVGNVVCADGQRSCWIHNSTCCPIKLSPTVQQYHCCPLPKAVCCEDGLHCCPQCFTCNVKNLLCMRPASPAAVVKMFSVLAVNQQSSPHIRGSSPPHQTSVKNPPHIKVTNPTPVSQTVRKSEEPAKKESVGFVSGVISAVKSTFFSSSKGSGGETESKHSGESSSRKSVTPPSVTKQSPPAAQKPAHVPLRKQAHVPIPIPANVPKPAHASVPKQAVPQVPKQAVPFVPKQAVPHVPKTVPHLPKQAASHTISPTQSKTASAGRSVTGTVHKPQSQSASISNPPNPRFKTLQANPGHNVGIKTKVKETAAGFRQPVAQMSSQGKAAPSQGVGTSGQRSTIAASTIKTQPTASKNANEVKEDSKSGFFSSVLSAVTDKFYPSPTKEKNQEKKEQQQLAGQTVTSRPSVHHPASAPPQGLKTSVQQQSSMRTSTGQAKPTTAARQTLTGKQPQPVHTHQQRQQPLVHAQQQKQPVHAQQTRAVPTTRGEPERKIAADKLKPNQMKVPSKSGPATASQKLQPYITASSDTRQQQLQQQHRQQQQQQLKYQPKHNQQHQQQQQHQRVSKPIHKL